MISCNKFQLYSHTFLQKVSRKVEEKRRKTVGKVQNYRKYASVLEKNGILEERCSLLLSIQLLFEIITKALINTHK